MLRRTVVVLAAVTALMATMLSGAAAGGGAVFEFNRDYYVAGDRAVGETVFWISEKDRHLLDRTFYAYLIPGQKWIEPPRIPDGAIPLGPVTLGGLARTSFTVPEVAPGAYSVGICDRPCRHSFVGDLMGGWITVVASEEEARLLPVIDRLEARLDRVRWNAIEKARKSQRHDAALRSQIGQLEEALDQDRDELGTRLAALERRPQDRPGAFDRAGWAVAAAALVALAFVSMRRRKSNFPAGLAPTASEATLEATPHHGDELEWRNEAAELEEERTPAGVG
jgi:hypothetical protein